MAPLAAGVTGLVLAAGAGVRAGGPKALRHGADGTPWLATVVGALRAGGCAQVVVALGAESERARPLVPGPARVVEVPDAATGLSASLRAGLAAVDAGTIAVLVALVDEPGLPAAAVRRIAASAAPDALVRAGYTGRPGHPVLLGREHLAAVAAAAVGDRGAGPYLAAHGARLVECGDLWDGRDVDGPPG
ncbi:MAG: NTP transferase domain-containing protein [Actinomycetales bacterium]|nr:NTP transferase domain-containing protein [Actinomycetales bacterium]